MKVRAAMELDLMPLISIAKEYVNEARRWDKLIFDPIRSVQYAATAIQDPNQQIFIAYEGSTILGFMWVAITSPVWSSDKIGYDLFLYVHSNHRNAKVGKALVTEFEKWAKACGCKAIHTGANSGIFKDNAASVLYKHSGYTPGGYNFYKEL